MEGSMPHLDIKAIIGYNGRTVKNSLHVHPNGENLVYALGCDVFITNLPKPKIPISLVASLSGHTSEVSCLAISKRGTFIASGCKTDDGYKADVIVWDFNGRSEYARFKLHMKKVEDVAFSPCEKYLVTLGGSDDGSVVVWNLETREAICGAPAQVPSAGVTTCLEYSSWDDNMFITGGDNTLRVWVLDLENRKIRAQDVDKGKVKRKVNCIVVPPNKPGPGDLMFFCGTDSGDIFSVNMNLKLAHINNQHVDKEKHNFQQGVKALAYLKEGEFLVGAGDGTIAIVRLEDKAPPKTAKPQKTEKVFRIKQKQQLSPEISAISLRGRGHEIYIGTTNCQMYRLTTADFKVTLAATSHYGPIYDICFAPGMDGERLFITCSFEDIRVWDTNTSTEVLRIVQPNMTCHAICIDPEGRCIFSGWSDGRIRIFGAQTGKCMGTIENAHSKEVTALLFITLPEGGALISGGGDCRINAWEFGWNFFSGKMDVGKSPRFALHEHQAKVTSLIFQGSKLCSTAHDGQCIIWNLEKRDKCVRENAFMGNTLYNCAAFHPENAQLITAGTDRKVAYQDIFGKTVIRELEGSISGSINGMAMAADGRRFISGGEDKLLKVWDYNTGEVICVGIGHTGTINKVIISPPSGGGVQKYIVSVGHDGAILRWDFPAGI